MSNTFFLKKRKLEILKEKAKLAERNKLWRFVPYDWQKDVWLAGKYNKQRLLIAGNQVGKTLCSTAELAFHVTGKYPAWWEGWKFGYGITAWALGVSADQIKRNIQAKLIGHRQHDGTFAGGYIPPDLLDHSSIVFGQVKNFVKEISIFNAFGTVSRLYFFSYEQGQHKLMGDIVDFALIDEEPKDSTIYPQVITRTINGARKSGGLILLSFTAENGMTELAYQFLENLQPGQFIKNVTWADAPHLTLERQEQLLQAFPEHQREMRRTGLPALGEGLVYPVNEDQISIEPFTIPDHFRKLGAIDFGYRTNAIMIGALDPDCDILYIYFAQTCSDMLPRQIAQIMLAQGDWMPWSWPQDGHLPDRDTGKEQKRLYEDRGVKMTPVFAQTDKKSTKREVGIARVLDRMKTGRLKIFKHLRPIFEEKRLYHRKNGLIVKKNDHLMDALRYLEVMLRFSTNKKETEFNLTRRYI